MKTSHSPNRFELLVSGVIIFLSLALTGVIVPYIISTNELSIWQIMTSMVFLCIGILIGMQEIFNYFYKKSQRKN